MPPTSAQEVSSAEPRTSALLLSEVATASGEHHLILVVRTAEGNIVLDNLDPNIRPVEMVRGQGRRLLDIFIVAASFESCVLRPTWVSYS